MKTNIVAFSMASQPVSQPFPDLLRKASAIEEGDGQSESFNAMDSRKPPVTGRLRWLQVVISKNAKLLCTWLRKLSMIFTGRHNVLPVVQLLYVNLFRHLESLIRSTRNRVLTIQCH